MGVLETAGSVSSWRDAYLLLLFIVSIAAMPSWRFSRWAGGIALVLWIGFAVLNAVAYTSAGRARKRKN